MADEGLTPKQKGDKDVRVCNACRAPLLTHAERKIGVHIGCVQDTYRHKITIRKAGYGNAR